MFCVPFRRVTVHILGLGALLLATKQGVPDHETGEPKRLWSNIFTFGLMHGGSDNVADELNAYLNTPAPSTSSLDTSHMSYRPLIQGDSFSFFCFDEMCVAVSIGTFTSNTTGLDGIPSSTFPFVWKISNVVPIPKVNSPMEKSDYRPISILHVLAKAIESVWLSKWLIMLPA
jgi:hypothetical protein